MDGDGDAGCVGGDGGIGVGFERMFEGLIT